MASGLDDDEIRNCEFAFRCTKTWSSLGRIQGQAKIRFCGDCLKAVHLCTTAADVRRHAGERHCVAIKRRDGGLMPLGDAIYPRR